MALWMVRAGKHGQREDLALDLGFAVIGWEELPDLSETKSREDLLAKMREVYPESKPNTIINWAGQVWTFKHVIAIGDYVVLPLKTRAAVAIGEVIGGYEYRTDLPPDVRHVRKVVWKVRDLPRSSIDQDLLYSLGAFLTVCRIRRNDAEARILALLTQPVDKPLPSIPTGEFAEDDAPRDIIGFARDQVREHVGKVFHRRELERLVEAILIAQGYRTQRAGSGADGGVDIVAGTGPLGFDNPRMVVQVKGGNSPVDVAVLRELRGTLSSFHANHALLVSWGGFTRSLIAEARRHFFEIRLWDSDDLLDTLMANYPALPVDIKAEIPLQQVWTLVNEAVED
jgi:restriction system protein